MNSPKGPAEVNSPFTNAQTRAIFLETPPRKSHSPNRERLRRLRGLTSIMYVVGESVPLFAKSRATGYSRLDRDLKGRRHLTWSSGSWRRQRRRDVYCDVGRGGTRCCLQDLLNQTTIDLDHKPRVPSSEIYCRVIPTDCLPQPFKEM